jgi:AAA+ superfamily predicted ATPase
VNTTGFLAGGAVLAVLTSCWSYVRSFIWRVVSLFIQHVTIESEDVHYPVIWHLMKNYKMSPIYDKIYGGNFEYRVDGRFGLVSYEHFGRKSLVFWAPLWWFIKCPVIICCKGGGQESSGGADSNNSNTSGSNNSIGEFSTITIIRWTINLDKVITQSCAFKNELAWEMLDSSNDKRQRFFIKRIPEGEGAKEGQSKNVESSTLAWYQREHFRLLDENPENLGRRNPSKQSSLDQLVFPEKVKDLINEIKLWRTSRKWYQERGVPWKRGWNLYGPPGTGKTALARAFAEDLDLPLFVFNLAEITSNMDLIKEWRAMQSNVPCIALIEDIDNVFHGRENITVRRRFGAMMMKNNGNNNGNDPSSNDEQGPDDGGGRWGLTFDCLLNCIDGVERNEGVFLVITTNDLTKVDEALGQPRKNANGELESISTRPGRIDKAIELTYMDNEDKIRLADRIMGDYPEEYAEMVKYVKDNPDEQETPAQFQERCAQLALKRYWTEMEEEIKNPDIVLKASTFGGRDFSNENGLESGIIVPKEITESLDDLPPVDTSTLQELAKSPTPLSE